MKKFILILIYVLIFTNVSLSETVYSSEEIYRINGAQVFVLDEKYKDNIDAFFKEAKAKGINTIFFRVFHNNKDRSHLGLDLKCESGVYYETSYACTVNDLLGDVVKAAHDNNMKLFAWMATRSLSFLKTDENMSMSLSAEGGQVKGYGANIFKKEVRDTLLGLFEDLAKYEIDGILFQDDFIIKYTEGSDKDAASLFEEETGIKVNSKSFFKSTKVYNGRKTFSEYTENFYTWAEWKSNQLALLFKQLKERAKTRNPKIKFAANIYYETPVDEKAGVAWYSQRLSVLKSSGADYFAVMGYFEQISDEKNYNRVNAAEYIGDIAVQAVKQVGSENAVIMKLQSKSFKGAGMLDYDDYKLVCRRTKLAGDISYAVVPVFSSSDIYTCPK